jgi:hypothetical protein
MKKRCPSGGVENIQIYILFIIGLFFILFAYIYYHHAHHIYNHHNHNHNHNNQPSTIVNIPKTETVLPLSLPFGMPTSVRPYPVPLMGDVLLNPYQPPLRDDRYFPTASLGGCGIPINVPTHSVNTTYRQVGILTRGDTILPLMGKPLFTNRDKWNFYTMNDKNNMIKLPLSNKGKSCTSEFGCDNIYNGDNVYVEGYNDAFKATVYDNQVMQYIPFL